MKKRKPALRLMYGAVDVGGIIAENYEFMWASSGICVWGKSQTLWF